MNLTIHCDQDQGPFAHFWRSTGFTPAELLLTRDMQQMLAYVGSIPHHGIQHVRIHYLLELVRVQQGADGSLVFDWSLLDEGLDVLARNGLKPFFEIMGNPSGYFDDFNDARQLGQWKEMVTSLAQHLMERYGRAEVESWYFENWNEPDGGWWPQWPQDETSFCNYYDACSEGLRAANSRLRFGGPGTCIHFSSLFKTFLAHCDRGKNYFTGETGVRLDFISVHEKGGPATPEDITPDSASMWQREAEVVAYLREQHPRLAGLPFMNNEADPQVGWQHFHTWRARPYYAALVCKVIHQHLLGLVDGLSVPYELVGNDNGFLGGWGQRTLLARLGQAGLIEDGQRRHQPQIVSETGVQAFPPFELVKKPVLNSLLMLALLGDTRLRVSGISANPDASLGVLATRRGDGQVAVLLYHSQDRITASGEEHVQLRLEGLPFEQAVLAHYRIDEAHSDPFVLWEAARAPQLPNADLLAKMRARQELEALQAPYAVQVKQGVLELAFDLPLPSVSLLLLSTPASDAPGRVQGVRLETYHGLDGQREVLVCWQGLDSRVLRSYEVLASGSPDGPYQRANPADLLCSAYLHVPGSADGPLYFKVRAVDYWGRAGEASEVAVFE